MARSNRSAEREAFWRGKLSAYERSGLNVRQFCEREGLAQPSFYSWRREIRKRDAEQSSEAVNDGQFLPVKVLEPCGSGARTDQVARLEIVTPDGFTLRFAHDTPADRVAALLDVIQRRQEGVRSC